MTGASPLPYPQQMWQTARVPAFWPETCARTGASATGDGIVRGGASGPDGR